MSTILKQEAPSVMQDLPSVEVGSRRPNLIQPGHDLTFAVHRGSGGLDAIEAAWTCLVARLPQVPLFFQKPQWFRAYVESLSTTPDDVCFITAHRGSELVAVFPLEYQKLPLKSFLKPKLLGTIDHDEMQLSDFVFARSQENRELFQQLFRWLVSGKSLPWDALRLRKVPDFGDLAVSAQARLPRWTQVLQHDASAWFDTSRDFEHATRPISGTFKRNLRRLSRRAEETLPLRHEAVSDPAALRTAMDHFLQIEASGWKGEKGTSSAISCNPGMLRFYETLMTRFGAAGECVINLLWYGDVPVAGQFCLKAGRTLNVLKVGYQVAHASFAPGNLLLERIIRDACSNPELDAVTLVNNPPWARNFKPLIVPVRSYFTPNTSVRGLLLLAALLIKRGWERAQQRLEEQKQQRQQAAAGKTGAPAPAAEAD